jgi:hypothetical protein
MDTLCGLNVGFSNAEAPGKHSSHGGLKGYERHVTYGAQLPRSVMFTCPSPT